MCHCWIGGQENYRYGSGYLEVAPIDTKRWPAPRVLCGTLLRMALSSIPCTFRVTRAKRMRCGYLEVAPRIPRGGPHHMCGVALCSVWHFAPLVIPQGAGTRDVISVTSQESGISCWVINRSGDKRQHGKY